MLLLLEVVVSKRALEAPAPNNCEVVNWRWNNFGLPPEVADEARAAVEVGAADDDDNDDNDACSLKFIAVILSWRWNFELAVCLDFGWPDNDDRLAIWWACHRERERDR